MSNGRLTQVQFLPSLLEDACSRQLGKYLQPLQCCNLNYLVSTIASKKSSQEACVTIKYRLENKGSEPSWIDIGVRRGIYQDDGQLRSEPSWIDIGVRQGEIKMANFESSEPSWIDIGVRQSNVLLVKVVGSEPSWIDIGARLLSVIELVRASS